MATPIIVTINDFKGYYNIASGLKAADISAEIVILEKEYLTKLLGVTLYDAYAAGTSQDWTDFKTGCTYTDLYGESRRWETNDLKNMLLGFLYYHIVENYIVKHTTTGYVDPKNQNSERVNKYQELTNMYERWNKSVDLYKKAYNYIYHTKDTKTSYANWAFTQIPYKNLIRY
jgi:hypothetical protein